MRRRKPGRPKQRKAPMETFGDRVRIIRQRLRISQHALALKLGTQSQQIWRWEHSQVKEPRGTVLRRLAALAGVSINWLLTGTEGEMPERIEEQTEQDRIAHKRLDELLAGNRASEVTRYLEFLAGEHETTAETIEPGPIEKQPRRRPERR